MAYTGAGGGVCGAEVGGDAWCAGVSSTTPVPMPWGALCGAEEGGDGWCASASSANPIPNPCGVGDQGVCHGVVEALVAFLPCLMHEVSCRRVGTRLG